MQIEDIVKSVSTMTDVEITERLREIRHSRGQQKEVSVTKRPTSTKGSAEDKLSQQLAGLNVKELEQLALLLQSGGK